MCQITRRLFKLFQNLLRCSVSRTRVQNEERRIKITKRTSPRQASTLPYLEEQILEQEQVWRLLLITLLKLPKLYTSRIVTIVHHKQLLSPRLLTIDRQFPEGGSSWVRCGFKLIMRPREQQSNRSFTLLTVVVNNSVSSETKKLTAGSRSIQFGAGTLKFHKAADSILRYK